MQQKSHGLSSLKGKGWKPDKRSSFFQSALSASSQPVYYTSGSGQGDWNFVPEGEVEFDKGLDDHRNKPRRAKSEQVVRDESLAAAKGKEGNSGRIRVSVTSYRRRLADLDNLAPKYFVDCLRYAGIIPDDDPQSIDYSVSQIKVRKKEEERTTIEINEAAC